ncbi:urease subunit alpha [Corynebacterium bovis]|nr:urease subunit alpha [Corynebacterium bovis]QQC47070.1 urease subunit alpha [Corynebacterium bovis]RRO81231.1 urease subunit alpha [Corynebacterium bovis]RRO83027.1 urease subunit alpha [Corynebacterium bovis]RRO84570.1 urease subunit alpha [Corynebacterium bovis]RRO95105.1 urease subunit alpha [Corynebacterium bovis]
MAEIDRQRYVELFGPTTGDLIRLADTNLRVRIEHDYSAVYPGDESVYGGGKAVRDGMAMDPGAENELDTVIVGVVVLDAKVGVVKGDVGIRDGRIVKIGKAGNPNTQDGVDPDLVIGPGTEVIAGQNRILTAGGIDTHIHYITPQQAEEGLSNGITTFFGGGTSPAEGTLGTTCTPGRSGIEFMLRAAEGMPVNTGFLGKGSASLHEGLRRQIRAGAAGLKIHEDWGATPKTIPVAMDLCDEFDVQLAIHTDTLNEGGFFESTARAFGGRPVHTFHSEGAGGGHAPDIIRVVGMPNVLPASTNPTLPYTVNSVEELLDMVMVCHHLSHDIPEDVAFADSRVRAETIAAETVLHDMGLISIFSSDSQAMGRVGESWARAFQTAHHCREQLGELEGDCGDDNNRVLRYVAKMTINPAIAQGIASHVGSIEPGKLADLVLWPTASFAAKPRLVLRQGRICWAVMGDPNASISTPEPVFFRHQFGDYGLALPATRATFMSRVAIEAGVPERLGLTSAVLPVENCRDIGKRDMVRNDTLADISVDPDTYEVRVNGEVATIDPADSLPLAQLHYLF